VGVMSCLSSLVETSDKPVSNFQKLEEVSRSISRDHMRHFEITDNDILVMVVGESERERERERGNWKGRDFVENVCEEEGRDDDDDERERERERKKEREADIHTLSYIYALTTVSYVTHHTTPHHQKKKDLLCYKIDPTLKNVRRWTTSSSTFIDDSTKWCG